MIKKNSFFENIPNYTALPVIIHLLSTLFLYSLDWPFSYAVSSLWKRPSDNSPCALYAVVRISFVHVAQLLYPSPNLFPMAPINQHRKLSTVCKSKSKCLKIVYV